MLWLVNGENLSMVVQKSIYRCGVQFTSLHIRYKKNPFYKQIAWASNFVLFISKHWIIYCLTYRPSLLGYNLGVSRTAMCLLSVDAATIGMVDPARAKNLYRLIGSHEDLRLAFTWVRRTWPSLCCLFRCIVLAPRVAQGIKLVSGLIGVLIIGGLLLVRVRYLPRCSK